MTTPTTASGTDPRSYVLPAGVTSNIPTTCGPRERGVFAAARGLLLEAATLLDGRPVRLHLQDNRGTFADGHVEVTVYAAVEVPTGKVLLTLVWGLGAGRTAWVLTEDHYAGRELTGHRHLGSADGRLPAPADLALLIADAA